jgi:hypothetical protein
MCGVMEAHCGQRLLIADQTGKDVTPHRDGLCAHKAAGKA